MVKLNFNEMLIDPLLIPLNQGNLLEHKYYNINVYKNKKHPNIKRYSLIIKNDCEIDFINYSNSINLHISNNVNHVIVKNINDVFVKIKEGRKNHFLLEGNNLNINGWFIHNMNDENGYYVYSKETLKFFNNHYNGGEYYIYKDTICTKEEKLIKEIIQ